MGAGAGWCRLEACPLGRDENLSAWTIWLFRMTQQTLTLIVPVLNEESQVGPFVERLQDALAETSVRWKALFVDDGSGDQTVSEIERLRAHGEPVEVLVLSRNFGKEAALTAGLDYAEGDIVIPIDVDLQDPPEVIPEMLSLWRDGADVVLAQRWSRHEETPFKRASASLYYRLMGWLSDTPLPTNVGDFRLLDRRVVEVIRNMPERTRYMKGILSWPGFTTAIVAYDRPARVSGAPRQRFRKLVRLGLDGIITFSSLPLRIWSVLGALMAAVAFAYMAWIVAKVLLFGRDVPGYASMMATILFVGGIQLLSVGILGEYVARIFVEVKRRPVYVVKGFGGRSQRAASGALPGQHHEDLE